MRTSNSHLLALLAFLLLVQSGNGWQVAAQNQVRLSTEVQPFVDRHEVAGAVMLVANKERVLAAEAVGWADIAGQKAMQTNSIFWIASQSKPITGAAFMILVDDGKVQLDDPVEKYLPEFRGQMFVAERDENHVLLKKPSHPLTIRSVLSHMSGLPFKSKLEEPTLDAFPLSARVRSYAMTPLESEPDAKYQYSNAGINTAARIIEVVTGQPFEKFIQERLLAPLQMQDTTFWPTAEQAERIAKAYRTAPDNKGLVETQIEQLHYPLTDRSERFPMPAGGLFSTGADLVKFYQMLLNGGQLGGKRVLSEQSVKELTRRQTPQTVKESYGLGFSASNTSFGHGGAYSTNSTADTELGLIFVWLVQHANFPGEGGKAQDVFRKSAREGFSAKGVSKFEYTADSRQPFWRGNVIHGESVLFIKESSTGVAKASVLFPIDKVEFAKNSAGTLTYEEGKDYVWKANSREIVLPQGSRIPSFTPEELRRPAQSQKYRLTHRDGKGEIYFGAQLEYAAMQTCFTYKHPSVDWGSPLPQFAAQSLPLTIKKLQQKEPLNIVLLGDSISSGANASGLFHEAPFQPAYPELLRLHLESHYQAKVNLVNLAVGGTDTGWGLTQIEKVIEQKPNLVVFAFGMNDSAGRPASEYGENTAKMIKQVREKLPDCEFILVATMLGNKDWITLKQELFPQYRDVLAALCGQGVTLADVTSVWTEFLKRKQDWDQSGNGVNHPNDFGHRVYSHVLAALLIPEK